VISIIFRSRKNWKSFDVSERRSDDDGDADLRIATHDDSFM